MTPIHFKVEAKYHGKKVQDFLKQAHGVSTTVLRKARRNEGGLTMNGKHIRTIDPVFTDCIISLDTGEEDSHYLKAELEIPIACEDSDIIIFDKPANMPCHPSKGHPYDTVANVFAANPSTVGLTFRCIGRLDSNTSGLVAVAKHPHACLMLSENMRKGYLAIVEGNLIHPLGTIDAPIGRKVEGLPVRTVRDDGKSAITNYQTLLTCDRLSLVFLWLETGRTHQIRVHMNHIGHTLLGDELYGGTRVEINRHALHCNIMHINTNSNPKKVMISLPQDMKSLLQSYFSDSEIETAVCKTSEIVIQL